MSLLTILRDYIVEEDRFVTPVKVTLNAEMSNRFGFVLDRALNELKNRDDDIYTTNLRQYYRKWEDYHNRLRRWTSKYSFAGRFAALLFPFPATVLKPYNRRRLTLVELWSRKEIGEIDLNDVNEMIELALANCNRPNWPLLTEDDRDIIHELAKELNQ